MLACLRGCLSLSVLYPCPLLLAFHSPIDFLFPSFLSLFIPCSSLSTTLVALYCLDLPSLSFPDYVLHSPFLLFFPWKCQGLNWGMSTSTVGKRGKCMVRSTPHFLMWANLGTILTKCPLSLSLVESWGRAALDLSLLSVVPQLLGKDSFLQCWNRFLWYWMAHCNGSCFSPKICGTHAH